MPSVEEELASRIAKGDAVVLATVIKLDGEPPSQAGAKLLMSGSNSIAGTLGCSEFDSAALADSDAVAAAAAPQMRTYPPPRPTCRRRLAPTCTSCTPTTTRRTS